MTISLVGITGATSTESVNMATLTRSTLRHKTGPGADPKDPKTDLTVYRTAPTDGTDPVWFTVRFTPDARGGGTYVMRVSATAVDDAAEEGEVSTDEVSAKLSITVGGVTPAVADLRMLISALYSLTYASVSSGTPNAVAMGDIAAGLTKLI
jgi:hypothetical protein